MSRYGVQPARRLVANRRETICQTADEVGVRCSHLMAALAGHTPPRDRVRERLPEVLGVPLEKLFTRDVLAVGFGERPTGGWGWNAGRRTRPQGCSPYLRRLTAEQAADIFRRYAEGESMLHLAREHDVSPVVVRAIWLGKTYRNVVEPLEELRVPEEERRRRQREQKLVRKIALLWDELERVRAGVVQ